MFRKGTFEPSRILGEFVGTLANFMVLAKAHASTIQINRIRRPASSSQPLALQAYRNNVQAQRAIAELHARLPIAR